MQEIEITVKVKGQVVKQQVEQVDGTLEQMEEKIDAMSRALAASALQASVDSVTSPRPFFRHRAENCGSPCDPDGCFDAKTSVIGGCIPTVSHWGVVVLAGVLLVAGTLFLRRRRGAFIRGTAG